MGRAELPLQPFSWPSGSATGPPSASGLLLPLRRRRPVQVRVRRGGGGAGRTVEVARDAVVLAERIVRRDAQLPREDRDRHAVLSVPVAGDEIAVVDPESIVSRSRAEGRTGERIALVR